MVIHDIASLSKKMRTLMLYKIPLLGFRFLAKYLVLLRCELAILFFVLYFLKTFASL